MWYPKRKKERRNKVKLNFDYSNMLLSIAQEQMQHAQVITLPKKLEFNVNTFSDDKYVPENSPCRLNCSVTAYHN